MFDDLSPNVIIILVVMVIGGIRWVIEQIRGKNRDQEEAPTSEFEDLYEEARLEILQRQGQTTPPPEQAAPPQFETATVIRPAAIPQPRRVSAPPPIPVGPTSPPPMRQPAQQKPQKRVLTTIEKEAIANFEALSMKPTKVRRQGRSAVSVHVRNLLSNPTSAQDAIVLADILGPPKGAI